MSSPKKWTHEEVCRLIEAYESHPILWDIKERDYKNRVKKNIILKQVATNFDTNVAEINRKIHNLRNQVSQELKKMKNKKSGGGASETNTWCYFSALSFIVPSLEVAASQCKLARQDGGSEYTVDENTIVSANTTTSRDQAQSTASSQSVSRVIPKTGGRKRQLDDLRSAEKKLKNVHDNLNNQPECQVSENEAFGQYITACLNKLPIQESVMLQSEIQSLVTKYRLRAVQTSETLSQALDEESEAWQQS